MQVEPGCELYYQKLETCAHLLWECPFARNEWAIVKGRVQKCNNEVQDFFQLFRKLVEKLTKKELEQWAACHGKIGMLGTRSTLRKSNHNQR